MMNKLIASLALSALGTTSAMASVFINAATVGGSQIEDFSEDGLIAFDLTVKDQAPVTLTYELTAADLAGPLAFNAVVANLATLPLERVQLSLNGTTFGNLGTVQRFFGGTASLAGAAGTANVFINLSSPEYYELAVGNPYAQAGQVDWLLSTGGLKAGDRLSITVAVPEPGAYALAVAGLAVAGMAARRRKA